METVISIDHPLDVALLQIAKGAAFGDTIMPSGFKVPAAPEGQAYYPMVIKDGWALVLRKLAPAHMTKG